MGDWADGTANGVYKAPYSGIWQRVEEGYARAVTAHGQAVDKGINNENYWYTFGYMLGWKNEYFSNHIPYEFSLIFTQGWVDGEGDRKTLIHETEMEIEVS